MQRGHNRHFEARQKLDDVPASLAAENAVLVLQGDGVEPAGVQDRGSLDIVTDYVGANFDAHAGWISIRTALIGHDDDSCFQVRPRHCHRLVQIMRKGGDATTAGQMVAYERQTLEGFH